MSSTPSSRSGTQEPSSPGGGGTGRPPPTAWPSAVATVSTVGSGAGFGAAGGGAGLGVALVDGGVLVGVGLGHAVQVLHDRRVLGRGGHGDGPRRQDVGRNGSVD